STVEKPLQIRSANPAIRFNETDRPANTPTYTLIANAGDWFIQKRDYDDAGSVSNAIAYNFANDRIDVQNLKASGLITANSVTTSSPVKSGGGRVEILGSVADFSAMSCYVLGLNSTGSSAAWVLGMHSGESKMVSLKNYHSNAEILLNGSDGAVQLKTGAVNG
ncbi:TPA: tail fiber domain-containing protein, partial [Escherichia coli]|nr:tail fiber domain-containing protein [Escherichia coli]